MTKSAKICGLSSRDETAEGIQNPFSCDSRALRLLDSSIPPFFSGLIWVVFSCSPDSLENIKYSRIELALWLLYYLTHYLSENLKNTIRSTLRHSEIRYRWHPLNFHAWPNLNFGQTSSNTFLAGSFYETSITFWSLQHELVPNTWLVLVDVTRRVLQ